MASGLTGTGIPGLTGWFLAYPRLLTLLPRNAKRIASEVWPQAMSKDIDDAYEAACKIQFSGRAA